MVIKGVLKVDEILNGCNIDVVECSEVEYYCVKIW